jgi:hypothetical protein
MLLSVKPPKWLTLDRSNDLAMGVWDVLIDRFGLLTAAAAASAAYLAHVLGWASDLTPTPTSSPSSTIACGSDGLKVPGDFLKAFKVALDDFNRLPNAGADKKNLENYDIYLLGTPEFYSITFSPRRVPGDQPTLGSGTNNGILRVYEIERKTFKVLLSTSPS